MPGYLQPMEARKGSCGEKRDTRNLNGTSEIAHDCRPTRLVATLVTAVQRGSWPLLGHDRGLPATLAHKNVRGLDVSMDEAGLVDAQDALQHVRDYISHNDDGQRPRRHHGRQRGAVELVHKTPAEFRPGAGEGVQELSHPRATHEPLCHNGLLSGIAHRSFLCLELFNRHPEAADGRRVHRAEGA